MSAISEVKDRQESYQQRKTNNHETDFRCSSSQVTNQYGAYTASPAKKTMSAISEVNDRQEASISSQWVEYYMRYKCQSAA